MQSTHLAMFQDQCHGRGFLFAVECKDSLVVLVPAFSFPERSTLPHTALS